MSLEERRDEISRLLVEADRHALANELTEAVEHTTQAITLMQDQIAAQITGEDN